MSEGPVNCIPKHCIDEHVADRPSKRAKTVGHQGLLLNQNDAITPRLTKQEVGVNRKGFSYETYVKNRSFMETL